ncbi:hypothetical protein [Marinicrinis lubricantis]|uniref:NIPSNAP protein n=1 Tax=Marinicrinis lubricantis TaxID=2086470 RepID=A0ABW1IU28_9BACL
MIRFKHVYQFKSQQRAAFSLYFQQNLIPELAKYQMECLFHGLIEGRDEMFAIWQAPDEAAHLHAMERLEADEQIQQLIGFQTHRIETGTTISSPQYAAVTVFVTNDKGEVLLVRNLQRGSCLAGESK